MSAHDVYVRCRDGALYKNPILLFPSGFVCFSAVEWPELVLWAVDQAGQPIRELPPISQILERIFGANSVSGISSPLEAQERVIPGTDPWVFRSASSFFFSIKRRIPRPQMHEGFERRPGRCRGTKILDWPVGPRDAYELDFEP